MNASSKIILFLFSLSCMLRILYLPLSGGKTRFIYDSNIYFGSIAHSKLWVSMASYFFIAGFAYITIRWCIPNKFTKNLIKHLTTHTK
jgi:hypothetical protein